MAHTVHTLAIYMITRTVLNFGTGAETSETFPAVENPLAMHELLAIDGTHRIAAKDCATEMRACGTMELAPGLAIQAANPDA